MSYCRFENTLSDLKDCLDALDEAGSVERLLEDANEREKPCVKKLITLCAEISRIYSEE